LTYIASPELAAYQFSCFFPLTSLPDVTEVQFALEPTAGGEKEPLTTNEYAVIAITSFCLGLMYIASVFLYIYFKKKKDQSSGTSSEELNKNFSREGKLANE
jgi:hypothetical protein